MSKDTGRWTLWLPVFLGLGAALYFALPVEPPAPAGLLGLLLVLVLAVAGGMRAGRPGAMALALLAALSLGFAAAKLRQQAVAAPVLSRTQTLHLTARVVASDPTAQGVRLILGDLRSGGFEAPPPAYASVSVRGHRQGFRAGDGVSLTARLMPPPGPAEPGDADFARADYFSGIGAVGFSYGAPIPAPLARPPTLGGRLSQATENLRGAMTARIRAVLPGSFGAIASAIITGQRGGIAPDDENALRDAGLAHVLAIAGLHMALVGGGIFWLARAAMAAFSFLALNYPIKKYAALLALAGAGFYLVISGASAASVRAFVMLAMMLLAILADRPALSMRSLGLAAAVLLLLRPQSIAEPGFQMSFAAVAALIAVAEWEQGQAMRHPRGVLWRYVKAIALTSLVGSLATMPFAAFTFDRAAHFAVLGNLIAMPVMGFVVMPAAALSVMAMPFHLESMPLHLMGWGLGVMVRAAYFVSGLPGAVSMAPAFPVWALAVMALGGLWLALWRGPRRFLGLPVLLAGLVLAWQAPRPDLLVAGDGRTVAIRAPDGLLYFPRKPKDNFAARRWLLRDGDDRDIRDAVRAVAVPEIDANRAARDGGYALYGKKLISVRQSRGQRPWVSVPAN